LDINAATTCDGLAKAAAVGAARIFRTEAVLIVVQLDGQLRRTSAAMHAATVMGELRHALGACPVPGGDRPDEGDLEVVHPSCRSTWIKTKDAPGPACACAAARTALPLPPPLAAGKTVHGC
jgi:hypothetical protein